MRNLLTKFTTIACLFVYTFGNAQTQTTSYNVPFASGTQNMWGPSWNAFSLNINQNLFDLPWNQSFNSGNGGITSILGFQFGAAIDVAFSGRIGANFIIDGFTTGTVEVDYPIDVNLVMNQDLTYDQGDNVSIQTDYTVDAGYALTSNYPSLGEIKLDVYFQFAGHLSATLCVFACSTFDIIPSFDTGLQTIHVMEASADGINFFGTDYVHHADGSIYYLYEYPNTMLPLTTSMIPGDPLGQFGLSAMLTLPYVETDDNLVGKNLTACGDSMYAKVDLNIFDLIGGVMEEIAPLTPPPADAVIEAIALVMQNLSASYDFGVAEIHWTLFDAGFTVDITNHQCFDFKPKVYGKFEFPLPVDYTVNDSIGAVVSQGTSAIIDLQLGNKLNYKYPCYYQELNITPTFSIDGQFTNHTYDVLSLKFYASALEIGASLPEVEITPEITIPSICIPYGYPCGFIHWCSGSVCTPEIVIPAVVFPGFSVNYGPLWSYNPTLASTSWDWFNQTWALEGFSKYKEVPFKMKANVLTTSVAVTDVSCFNDATGAIDLSYQAVSPATPYTYVWTNGATTQDLSNLSADSYQVEVRDAHDCPLYNGAVITQPADSVLIASSFTDKLCNGGANSGSIDIDVSGGTAPYAYAWSSGQNTQDINSLDVGTYTLTVTDAKNCIEQSTISISEPPVLGQVATVQALACNGVATGSIVANAYGGTMPYQYSWSSGQTSSTIQNIASGNYTLTVTDANGCNTIVNYPVTQPASPLSLSAVTTNVLCKGDATGAINISTVGGTATYTYAWSDANGVLMPNQTEDLNNLMAGTYVLNVRDENGCESQISQTITEPVAMLSSTPVLQNINCNGASTGQIDPVIAGGTPGYSYAWSTGANSSLLSNITAGNYSLNLTDNNGCTKTFNYLLTEPANPIAITLSNTNVKCYGDSTGEIGTLTTGGTNPYAYSWNNGQVTGNLSNLPAGNYALTVTDNKGCIEKDSIVITQPNFALASSGLVTDVNCFGDLTGAIALTATGGTTPYQYEWTNGDSLILTQNTANITGLPSNAYSVLVTDANGCKTRFNATVNQPAATLSMRDTVIDVLCYGMPTGAVDITMAGGTAPYTYNWSNGASSEDIASVLAGSYYLTVTDSKACIYVDSATISQPASALVANASATQVKCNGGTDGTVTSTVSGGVSPYTYLWSDGSTDNEIIGTPAGTYNLTVTDANGCTSFTGTTVGEPSQALVVTPSITDVQCYGGNDGKVVITMTGGVPPYAYNWGNQNEILLNHFSETITGLDQGEYFIRVTDRNGCKNEQYLTINQPQQVVIQDTVTDVLCFADSTGAIDISVVGGTPTYTYLWSNGTSSEDAVNLPSGTYIVLVKDAHACEYRDTAVVSQPQKLDLHYEIQGISCEDQADAAITVEVYGGAQPYLYTWSTGSVESSIENLKPATYTLEITDGNGCNLDYTFVIHESEVKCVQIPNTITPNGDNYNDTWVIRNLDLYPNASVKIFNKWGNLVYASTGSYKPWDGTYYGKPLPSEVYYYVIVLGNTDNDEYTGTITIIR
jgi:gliding motility-associated-like protein